MKRNIYLKFNNSDKKWLILKLINYLFLYYFNVCMFHVEQAFSSNILSIQPHILHSIDAPPLAQTIYPG